MSDCDEVRRLIEAADAVGPQCCDSCHEDFDTGHPMLELELTHPDAPGSTTATVCYAVVNALEAALDGGRPTQPEAPDSKRDGFVAAIMPDAVMLEGGGWRCPRCDGTVIELGVLSGCCTCCVPHRAAEAQVAGMDPAADLVVRIRPVAPAEHVVFEQAVGDELDALPPLPRFRCAPCPRCGSELTPCQKPPCWQPATT